MMGMFWYSMLCMRELLGRTCRFCFLFEGLSLHLCCFHLLILLIWTWFGPDHHWLNLLFCCQVVHLYMTFLIVPVQCKSCFDVIMLPIVKAQLPSFFDELCCNEQNFRFAIHLVYNLLEIWMRLWLMNLPYPCVVSSWFRNILWPPAWNYQVLAFHALHQTFAFQFKRCPP